MGRKKVGRNSRFVFDEAKNLLDEKQRQEAVLRTREAMREGVAAAISRTPGGGITYVASPEEVRAVQDYRRANPANVSSPEEFYRQAQDYRRANPSTSIRDQSLFGRSPILDPLYGPSARFGRQRYPIGDQTYFWTYTGSAPGVAVRAARWTGERGPQDPYPEGCDPQRCTLLKEEFYLREANSRASCVLEWVDPEQQGPDLAVDLVVDGGGWSARTNYVAADGPEELTPAGYTVDSEGAVTAYWTDSTPESGVQVSIGIILKQHGRATAKCAACGANDLVWAHAHDGGSPNCVTTSASWCVPCSCGCELMLTSNGSELHSCVRSPGLTGNSDGAGISVDDGRSPEDANPDDDPWLNVQMQSTDDGNSIDATDFLQGPSEADAVVEMDAETMKRAAERAAKSGSGKAQSTPREGEDQDGDGGDQAEPEYVTHPQLDAGLTEFAIRYTDVMRNHFATKVRVDKLSAVTLKRFEAQDKNIFAIQNGLGNVNQKVREMGRMFSEFSSAANTVAPQGRLVTIEIKRQDGKTEKLDQLTHRMLPALVSVLQAREHVLMVGPAGTGKSKMARQAAEILGLEFYAEPLNPQTPVSKILGYMQAEGRYVPTLWRKCYEEGGVFFLDELDNASPAVLAVINDGVTENGSMAFPDRMVKCHKDFYVVAAANTFGRGPDRTYAARQRGDAATWDRFSILDVDYDTALEHVLCKRTGLEDAAVNEVLRFVRALRKQARELELPVVVGQRAAVGMCRLLKVGMPVERAVDSRVRRGLSDQDWTNLTRDVRMPNVRQTPTPLEGSVVPGGTTRVPDGFVTVETGEAVKVAQQPKPRNPKARKITATGK